MLTFCQNRFSTANVHRIVDQPTYEHAREEFSVPGIGKLVMVERKARTARNPNTGASIQVPAKKALKFRIAKAAKDAILGAVTIQQKGINPGVESGSNSPGASQGPSATP